MKPGKENKQNPEPKALTSSEVKTIAIEQPNVKWVAKGVRPFREVSVAGNMIQLPQAEVQEKGFYHERAGELVRVLPHYYKPLVNKGD